MAKNYFILISIILGEAKVMKFLVRANCLCMWDGFLETKSKHIKTEWSEVFQERSLDLLDEESLSLYMYCHFFYNI